MNSDISLFNHLKVNGFDPIDAPFTPIQSHWEQCPIVQCIRQWEKLTGKIYISIESK